jgi:hypothetical protein
LRELSLHLLDLVENAIRAGATTIAVGVEEEPDRDLMVLSVEDDGPGLPVSAETATDPFFTTKEGKKTGLGLSLLKFRAEQSGGRFRLARSALGGLEVRAELPLSSVDRSPLGDLAATLASVVCTNPEVDLRSRLRVGDRRWEVSSAEISRTLPSGSLGAIALARRMKERILEGLSDLHVTA